MRDRQTIDSELRRIATVRRSMREQGGEPSCREVDELLDERLSDGAEASEIEGVVADTRRDLVETDDITPYRRRGVLRRFGPLAVLPLSLVAVGAALVVMFAVHPHPAAQPPVVPPASESPHPAAPKAPASALDTVDRVFIDA